MRIRNAKLNGVDHSLAVSSSIFFCIYIDELLGSFRDGRIGCHIRGKFYGAFIFADDVILLSAIRNGLQAMVDKCSSFEKSRNLTFGTDNDPKKSKTKSIIFSKKPPKNPIAIVLDGNDLPWVASLVHLGCTLQSENNRFFLVEKA